MTQTATQPEHARPTYVVTVGVAIVLAVVYLLTVPHTADLATQTARVDLFRRSGLVPYWTGWYAGSPTASYSLLSPPLLGWLGSGWLGALCVVATGLVAVPLLRDARRPTSGALAVVVVATLNVFSGRTTFALGVVFALAAALATERRRPFLAGVLGLVATAASPVAGVLLAVVAGGTVLAGPRRRWAALNVLGGVGIGLVVIAYLSRGSSSGYEPLTRTSLLISLLTTFVVIISPVGRRLRTIGWLVVWLLIGCYFVHSAVGANATRIAILGSAPAVVAAARWPKPLLVLATVAAAFLPISQFHNDLANSGGVESTSAYVAGLRAHLLSEPGIVAHRVEVVDTYSHWPSTYLVRSLSIARGWVRQTDEAQNPLFYGRAPLTAATYRAFLDRDAVDFVAVPRKVKFDYGSKTEAALIRSGLPYLTPTWSDAHWQLYAVSNPTSIASAPCSVVARSDTGVTVRAPGGASCDLRLNWSPYLVTADGSVSRGPDDTVRLQLAGHGHSEIEDPLHARWSWP